MKYEHYVLIHIKYYLLIGFGISFGFTGIGLGVWSASILNRGLMMMGFIMMLIGGGITWYGFYKINELYFHREEGNRVYVQKARWR